MLLYILIYDVVCYEDTWQHTRFVIPAISSALYSFTAEQGTITQSVRRNEACGGFKA